MGPRSIDRGTYSALPSGRRTIVLQWGRDQLIAGLVAEALVNDRLGFNGAAIN